MSISTSKLDANRNNAAHSTGPVTAEGKARSSQNARTHGWFARDLIIPPQHREAYDQLRQECLEELRPDSALQWDAFHDFLHAAWRKNQVREAIAALDAQNEANPFLDATRAREYDRLHRYLGSFEARCRSALRQLRDLQKRTQTPPPPAVQGTADPELEDTLRVMAVETAYMNARWRSYKAGLLAFQAKEPSSGDIHAEASPRQSPAAPHPA